MVAMVEKYDLGEDQKRDMVNIAAEDMYFRLDEAQQLLNSSLMRQTTSLDRIDAVKRCVWRHCVGAARCCARGLCRAAGAVV